MSMNRMWSWLGPALGSETLKIGGGINSLRDCQAHCDRCSCCNWSNKSAERRKEDTKARSGAKMKAASRIYKVNYYYCYCFLLLFMLIQVSSSLGALTSKPKLQVMNNQHAPSRSKPHLPIRQITTPHPVVTVPQLSNVSDYATVNKTSTFAPQQVVSITSTSTTLLPSTTRSQRENDRRLPSEKLLESHSMMSFTATTQFDDDHDDLYDLGTKLVTPLNGNSSMISAYFGGQNKTNATNYPKNALKSAREYTGLESSRSYLANFDDEDNEINAEIQNRNHQEMRRNNSKFSYAKAPTSRRSASNELTSSTAALIHLAPASEYSLLPRAPPSVDEGDLLQSSVAIADNDVDSDGADYLGQLDRNSMMMMRLTQSPSQSDDLQQKKSNSSAKTRRRHQPIAAEYSKHNLADNDDDVVGKLSSINISSSSSSSGQQQLDSILLNNDVLVRSELLVLNKSSPLDGLMVRNLSGKAELRNSHSVKSVQLANNSDDSDREQQQQQLVGAEGMNSTSQQQWPLAAAGYPPPSRLAVHDYNVLDLEDSPAQLPKLNWRGGSIEDFPTVEEQRLPLRQREVGPFYGPFSSSSATKHLNGLRNERPLSIQINNNTATGGSAMRNGNHSVSAFPIPSDHLVVPLNVDLLSGGSNSKGIRLKAAASMTGIRVVADPKQVSQLVINSRGLITAPKRRVITRGSSQTNVTSSTNKNKKLPVKKEEKPVRLVSQKDHSLSSHNDFMASKGGSLIQSTDPDSDRRDWPSSQTSYTPLSPDRTYLMKNSSSSKFGQQAAYDLLPEVGHNSSISSEAFAPPFLVSKSNQSFSSSQMDRHPFSPPALQHQLVFQDISVLDGGGEEGSNSIEQDSSKRPAVDLVDWLASLNASIAANKGSNFSSNQQSFYHNPPYKQHLPSTPSNMNLDQPSNNLTQIFTGKHNSTNQQRHHHKHQQANSLSHQDQRKWTTTSPLPASSYDIQESDISAANSSSVGGNTKPPYESSASLISVDSTSIAPQLNTLNVNKPPVSHQHQVTATNHSSHNNNNKPTSSKFKSKLQNMIIGKILKNAHNQFGNFTAGQFPNSGTTTTTTSSSSIQPSSGSQWSNLLTSTLSAASSQTTPTSMITPPPLLSTTVANNVASLLAQKLNSLVSKPSFSFGSPAVSSINHFQSPTTGGSGGLSSLFGIRVANNNNHHNHHHHHQVAATTTTTPTAAASAVLNSGGLSNKFKQRINPFAGTAHSSVNRRTAGVGSLLISGFIYGLSVLPALMALTGINPLSQSYSDGVDQATSASSSSSVAHAHPVKNSSGSKRSTKRPQASATSKAQRARLVQPASSAHAYLVPLIPTVPADSSGLDEPTTGGGGASGTADNYHAQQTAMKALYAPPPTIIEPVGAEPHPILDELSTYDASPLPLNTQLKDNSGTHDHHHQYPYHQRQVAHLMETPSSLQLASSMRLINEQLYPTYQTSTNYKTHHHHHHPSDFDRSSNSGNHNHWPSADRADEYGDEINDEDNLSSSWQPEDKMESIRDYHNRHSQQIRQKQHASRGQNARDPIAAGGSQRYITIAKAGVVPRSSRRNSIDKKVEIPQTTRSFQVGYTLNYTPVPTRSKPKPKLIEFQSVNDVTITPTTNSYYNAGGDYDTSQWRAIPAPFVKGRPKYNLNEGLRQRKPFKKANEGENSNKRLAMTADGRS